MLRTRFRVLLLAAAVTALALVFAGCGSEKVPAGGVAKVGDVTITRAQFDHWFLVGARQQAQSTGQNPASVTVPDPPTFSHCVAEKAKQPLPKGVPKPKPSDLRAQCKQEYEGLRDQTLQFLISSQWLLQEAARMHITASPQEVRTNFNQQKKQSFPKEADYQKFLRTSGQTEPDLLFRVKISILTNKLQAAIVKGKDKVSDAQITSFYNQNKSRYATPETRDLLVVLTPKKPQADAALAAIRSGTPWAKVAKKYSTDDASKSQGGKLPNVTRGQQERAFDTAIFSAPLNKVEGPVKTQFGFYVFKVTKITPAKQQTLAQVRETIRSMLISQNQQRALNSFVTDFQKRYTSKTLCAKGFVIQQCKNAPKQPQTPSGGAAGPQVTPPQQQVPQGGVPGQPTPQGGGSVPQTAPPQGGGTGGAPPPSGGGAPTP